MATTQSVWAGTTIVSRAISKDFLLNFFFKGELQVQRKFYDNIAEQIATWFHGQVSHRRALFFVILTFILTLVVSGIVEGAVYDIWSHSVVPWLSQRSAFTHLLLLMIATGWIFFVLTLIILSGIYGANRQKVGQLETITQQLETITQQNEEREQETIQLNIQIHELSRKLTQHQEFTDKVAPELEQLRRVTKLLELIRNTDRELFIMFTQLEFTEEVVQNYFEVIFRRIFELWGMDKVHRCCIYVPDENNTEFLTIKWEYGLGAASRRWDKWYIGDHDPVARNLSRGIAGIVYKKGEDRVNGDVTKDPDFVDLYQPRRTSLPYRSSVHALIHPDDIQVKLGVLCLDSMNYVFTQHDLTLVQQVATRMGWLIQTASTRKGQG